MSNKRLFLSLPEGDLNKLDARRAELGMNRSEYIRFIISGQRKRIPFSVKQRYLVDVLSEVDLHLRAICLKEGIEAKDVLYITESLKEIKRQLFENGTCGQSDHKLEGGDERG